MNSMLLWLESSLYPDGCGKQYAALHSYDDLLKILLTLSHMLSSARGIFPKHMCAVAKQSAYPILIMLRWEACLIPHLCKEEADKPSTGVDKLYQPGQVARK